MNYEREKYEKLIDSSILFTLDKEKEYTAYKREALKMVEYLYCYLMSLKKKNEYEDYALEIVEVAKLCIENYKPDSGRFLNYFSSAWKKQYGHICGNESIDKEFDGAHFTETDLRNYKKYKRLAQSMNVDTDSPEFNKKMAEAMNKTEEEVEFLRLMDKNRRKNRTDEEDEKDDQFDKIDSGIYTDTGIIQLEAAKELLDLIGMTFDELQERQKPMLSMLITSKLSMIVCSDKKLLEYMKNMPFYDEDTYEKTLKQVEPIQAKEIAEHFGVSEASASRSWNRFKDGIESNKKK